MKYKILHIITRLDAGGSSTNTIETVARLDKNKYDVDLVAGATCDPDGSIEKNLQLKAIKYAFLNYLCRNISPLKDIKAFFALYKIIRAGKYDIVHTHSSKAGILGRWAAKIAGAKIIVHTPHGHIFYGYFNKFVTFMFILIERITSLITSKIIALTNIGLEEHLAFKIANRDKFVQIYSGIELKACEPSVTGVEDICRSFGIKSRNIIFGTISRLTHIKGNKNLVEAFALVVRSIPDSMLLIIGDGEERKAIEVMIEELNINDSVKMLGFRDDIAELLKVIDIFVMASLNEGMGRVALEAMAVGKPVIATRTGGIPELVLDGETGILVEPSNVRELANAMIKLANDKEKMSLFSANGMKRVSDKFSIEKMVNDIDQLYYDLMGKIK